MTSRAECRPTYTGTSFDEAFFYGFQLPSYTIAAARLGLSTDRWSATLFVDNLTNKVAKFDCQQHELPVQHPRLDPLYHDPSRGPSGLKSNYRF